MHVCVCVRVRTCASVKGREVLLQRTMKKRAITAQIHRHTQQADTHACNTNLCFVFLHGKQRLCSTAFAFDGRMKNIHVLFACVLRVTHKRAMLLLAQVAVEVVLQGAPSDHSSTRLAQNVLTAAERHVSRE